MPYYTSLCTECGEEFSYFAKIADRNDTPTCHGKPTVKLLDTPMVSAMGVADNYQVTNLAPHTLYGRTQVNAYLKQHNLISQEEGAQEATHQKAQQERADKAQRREDIRRAVSQHL